MSHLKAKELSKLGYTDDIARSLAINLLPKHYKHAGKAAWIEILTNLKNNPEAYVNDSILGPIAATFLDSTAPPVYKTYELLQQTGPLRIYGGKNIEQGARRQMETAMSLPVSLQGALMPDAHNGYGLPIGGVLAAKDALIPYAVGVDIGCRMSLSILDEGESFLRSHAYQMKKALSEQTHFGMTGSLDKPQEHEVLDHSLFRELGLLRKLQPKAARQLGSSGTGNHFVEFGLIRLQEGNSLHLPAGAYMALLSHSGSRGLGAGIAQHYIQVAMDNCKLPGEAQRLAWLAWHSEAGQEYWLSMNLAGDYAKACHDRIHANVLQATGLHAIARVENHHNFAWQDILPDGETAIIHRKGATPAHEGELGIIPGSMSTPAYLVRGKGAAGSLYSAAHGAGRAMSRKRARASATVSALKKLLADAGVTLIGGSPEESPVAYKDIAAVMSAQDMLVSTEGMFYPKIVRMYKE